jgi:hemerythrin-like domain-containing protein
MSTQDRIGEEAIDMKATQQLRYEHDGVKVMLNILGQVCIKLEATGNLNEDHFDGILEFLKVFVDRCHHGKEEKLLFPALIGSGVPEHGPIAIMLHEHEVGRDFINIMSTAFAGYIAGDISSVADIVQNTRGYIALLRNHIEKENDGLFVIADKSLTEIMQDVLFEGFEKIEEEQIGVGKHDEFHKLIEKLSKIYLS